MSHIIEKKSIQPELKSGADELLPFELALGRLFFPDQQVTISAISHWSDNVKLIKTPNGEFVGKRLPVNEYQLKVLDTAHEWSDHINQTNGIIAPKFIATTNGIHFPLIHDNEDFYLLVMPRIDNIPFELTDTKDYERMGAAIGLLHKAAPKKHSVIRQFEFSKTNPFVEKFWNLLTLEELELFNEILAASSGLNELPSQLTHNDVHPENLLSCNGTPLFIDFDQMLTGPRINDLGQALSAFWLDESESGFERAAVALIHGYNLISPLTPEEIKSLSLFALRKACISFTWYKGLMQNRDSTNLQWYQRILHRSYIIRGSLKKQGFL